MRRSASRARYKMFAKNLKKVYICSGENLEKVYNMMKQNLKKVQILSL